LAGAGGRWSGRDISRIAAGGEGMGFGASRTIGADGRSCGIDSRRGSRGMGTACGISRSGPDAGGICSGRILSRGIGGAGRSSDCCSRNV
jgi:hypothetical protein